MARSAQILTGSRRARARSVVESRQVVEGRVVEVIGRRARVRLGSGRVVECRCAHGIDLPWLQSAVAVGPVDAELSIGESDGSLWAIFPGPEHDEVLPEEVNVRASRSVKITAGAASLTLTRDGRATMRGRDLVARGSRSARLTGGTVRLA